MATLQDIVQQHLELHGKSIRSLAKEARITYPTLLGVVNRGSVPRRQEHRESLREALGLDPEAWANILVESTTEGVAIAPGRTPTLQQLISQKMYACGLTEQRLADDAGVAYSTIMGITRKGSIPREDSLNKVVDILGIEPEEIRASVAASRAQRRTGMDDDEDEDEEEEVIGLAQLVARHMRNRGQSMGSFAKDLGIGYFRIARFLETGQPFEEQSQLEALRHMLDLDKEHFQAALELSREDPEPADLGPADELLGEDANALQHAIVDYMRKNDLTLKALAKRADLSQVTVSRLVKQGQAPTRATTHIKLQELLELDPDRYQLLVSTSSPASAALLSKIDDEEEDEEDRYEEESDDGYAPQHLADHQPKVEAQVVPTKDELIALVKRLGPKQREALKTFLAAMV